MAKLAVEMDLLEIDSGGLSDAVLMPIMKAAMSEILTDHGRKAGSGLNPDGGRQKQNSEPYKSYKAGKVRESGKNKGKAGIETPEGWKTGTIPTHLTGQMHSSRNIVTLGNEVQGKFDDQGGKKARSLVEKGYKIHYFSDQNVKAIETRIADAAGKALADSIKVRRK